MLASDFTGMLASMDFFFKAGFDPPEKNVFWLRLEEKNWYAGFAPPPDVPPLKAAFFVL